MSSCSYCHEKMPKKEVLEHVKICGELTERHQKRALQTLYPQASALDDPWDIGQPTPVSVDRVRDEACSGQNDPSRQIDVEQPAGTLARTNPGSSGPTDHRRETLSEIDDLKKEIVKLRHLWSDSHSLITDQGKKIAKLEAALGEKDNHIRQLTEESVSNQAQIAELKQALSKTNDYELLTETVNSQQIDMKNIQVRCDGAVQSISDMKEKCDSLEERVSAVDGESKHRIEMIEDTFRSMKACFTAACNEFQHSKQNMEQRCREVDQLKTVYELLKASHDNLLSAVIPIQLWYQQCCYPEYRQQ